MEESSTGRAAVVLGVDARVAVVDDEAGFGLLLRDAKGRTVRVEVPRNADAWIAVRGLSRRLEEATFPVKMATVGYAAEHGPHTGPGAFRPLLHADQDPFGGFNSGAG
jgi:hypothetical protein